MITWRLWRALKNPPLDHPLFQRAVYAHTVQRGWRKRFAQLPELLLAIFFLCLLALGIITLAQGLTFVAILAVLIIFGGTLYGLDWSVAISDTVTKERETGTLEVLSLIPSGAFGALWYIALGQLHREDSFYRRLARFDRIIIMMMALIVILVIGVLSQGGSPFWSQFALALAALVAFTSAAYLDFIQSIITGTLIGLISPTLSRQRFDAQLWAIAGFLSAQIGTYLLVYLVGFGMLPVMGQAFGAEGTTLELLLILPRLIAFLLIREALIALLWRWILLQFNEEVSVIKI